MGDGEALLPWPSGGVDGLGDGVSVGGGVDGLGDGLVSPVTCSVTWVCRGTVAPAAGF